MTNDVRLYNSTNDGNGVGAAGLCVLVAVALGGGTAALVAISLGAIAVACAIGLCGIVAIALMLAAVLWATRAKMRAQHRRLIDALLREQPPTAATPEPRVVIMAAPGTETACPSTESFRLEKLTR